MSRESEVLEPEVERKLAAAWHSEEDRASARAQLGRYGVESHERDTERVRLAIIKLGGDALGELHLLTDAAKGDYRGVLMWAESPEEAKALWAVNPDLTDQRVPRATNGLKPRERAEISQGGGEAGSERRQEGEIHFFFLPASPPPCEISPGFNVIDVLVGVGQPTGAPLADPTFIHAELHDQVDPEWEERPHDVYDPPERGRMCVVANNGRGAERDATDHDADRP
ncbi:hypothetical protein [Sorangium sp. So ce381]|uniref:hypothetical protein n=1 Tax=Sorangium sp. So ce381 TaxID=3133307 RepID=UPI003F5B83D9